MSRIQVLLVLALMGLVGCGQVSVFGHTIGEAKSSTPTAKVEPATAKLAPTVAASVPAKSGVQVIKAVTLSVTPEAAAKIANDSRFNADALLEVVKKELHARQLLDESNVDAPGAEILIDDFSARLTSNAVVFGYIISDGTLVGNLRLREAAGKDLQSFAVEAKAKMSSPAGVEDKNPLGPLYQRFAVLAGDRLAGTVSKPDNARDQLAR